MIKANFNTRKFVILTGFVKINRTIDNMKIGIKPPKHSKIYHKRVLRQLAPLK